MNWETYHPAKKIVLIIGGTILGIGVAILVGFIIMWLWNGLMPKLFNLPMITYWQGLGMGLLGRLLFGGIGGGNSKDSSSKRKGKQRMSHCEDAYETDWEKYDKWWEKEGKKSYDEFDKEPEEVEEVTSNE
ncbi:MAG: hypothetical protein J7L40_03580 [Candidatus Marinimicrobia bacterium]|nr:hypothetical protein [Candidatus Neomarinimicrobiota bacterium]